MKLIAIEKRNYTMQHWQARTAIDGAGNTAVTYFPMGAVKGTIVSGRQQTYLFTDDALFMGDQLREVKDADGQPVFIVGTYEYPVYVHNSSPVVDIYGRVTGYRHVLRDYAPAAPVGGQH